MQTKPNVIKLHAVMMLIYVMYIVCACLNDTLSVKHEYPKKKQILENALFFSTEFTVNVVWSITSVFPKQVVWQAIPRFWLLIL